LTHAYCWPEVRRGAERFISDLGAALAERHHDVVVFSAARAPGRTSERGVQLVKLRQRRGHGLGHEADFGRRVTPYLAAGRFDAVHSLGRRDAVASIRAARVRRGRRTIFTDLGNPIRAFWDRQVGETQFHDRVVRDIDVYGCMSRFALDALAKDYGRRGVLTPGGVDTAQFTPARRRAANPALLFSGALDEPRKGVAQLLRALPIVARTEPRVELWLSGPGDAASLLAAAPRPASERTKVLGLGEPGDQPRRYGEAWATVLASKHDSFGMVLIESLACGTPVVGGDDAAVPELVRPGAGVLCHPDDPESIAAACLLALDLARRSETVDACRAVAMPFDWRSSLAPRFERYYAGELDCP
jgi:phosphatidylinositol alpha-mannosyltransferase